MIKLRDDLLIAALICFIIDKKLFDDFALYLVDFLKNIEEVD